MSETPAKPQVEGRKSATQPGTQQKQRERTLKATQAKDNHYNTEPRRTTTNKFPKPKPTQTGSSQSKKPRLENSKSTPRRKVSNAAIRPEGTTRRRPKQSQRRKSKKKRKARPPLKLKPPPPPEPVPRKGERTLKANYTVIITLWFAEILHVICETLKGPFSRTTVRFNQETVSLAHNIILMIVICIATVTAGFLAQKIAFKYWVLIAGVCLYAATPVFGYTYTGNVQASSMTLLNLLQIGWFIGNPLRLFLIFHQRWPLNVKHTKIITCVCMTVVAVVSYLMTVFVYQSEGIDDKTMRWLWLSLLVLMMLWLLVALAVKFLMLENPIEHKAIEEIYEFTSAYPAFQHREEKLWLFVALLIPSGMFIILSHVSTLSLSPYKDSMLYKYRLDMVVSMVIIGAYTLIMKLMPCVRDDMKDLVIICGAHLFNLLCLVLFLLVASRISQDRHSPQTYDSRASQVNEVQSWGCVIIVKPAEWQPFTIDIEGSPKVQVHNRRLFYRMWMKTKRAQKLKITGKVGESKYFEGTVEFIPNQIKFYFIEKRHSQLMYIRRSEELHPNKRLGGVYNVMENCQPPLHGVKLIGGKCKVIVFEVRLFQDSIGKQLLWGKDFFIPKQFEPPEYFPLKGGYIEIAVKVDGKMLSPDVQTLVLPDKISILLFPAHGGLDAFNFMAITTLMYENEPDEPAVPAILLIFHLTSNVVLGAARVCYIHFMWIKAPYRGRALVLAGYCTFLYVVEWSCAVTVKQVNQLIVIIMLILQIICGCLHLFLMFVFRRGLPKLPIEAGGERHQF